MYFDKSFYFLSVALLLFSSSSLMPSGTEVFSPEINASTNEAKALFRPHDTPTGIHSLFLELPEFDSRRKVVQWMNKLEKSPCSDCNYLQQEDEEINIAGITLDSHPLFTLSTDKHQLAAFCSEDEKTFSIYLKINYQGKQSSTILEKELSHVTNHLVSSLSDSHLFRPISVEESQGHVQFFQKNTVEQHSPYKLESLDIKWKATQEGGSIIFRLHRVCPTLHH